METSEQYLKYAEDCDRMSKELPAHAETLKIIADAWRSLAVQAEQKEKAPPLGSVTQREHCRWLGVRQLVAASQ